MCLVLVAWQAHPEFPLVVAANRDEFYWRATDSLGWWDEPRRILAGRDRSSAGTWMGITSNLRFAAVTNVRSGPRSGGDKPLKSRGNLPTDFMRADTTPQDQASAVHAEGGEYGGFNMICSDLRDLWWVSNRSPRSPQNVEPGIHGISNAALNTPWPKVTGGKAEFAAALAADDGSDSAVTSYLDLLHDKRYAPRAELPHTGVDPVSEKLLSSRFVRMGFYGTRSSTVLRVRRDGSFDVTERRFGPLRQIGEARFTSAETQRL
ncbi:NRDE family protein [Antrihabitans stalactiti]|uniref:NRDE family protein n=1 Tax=Antrihabitans stalactiti TaxID=2584121 RepID=A0A848KUW3_9NOCA|nr:NRDE family protein [Antrihabitans stalactiti]